MPPVREIGESVATWTFNASKKQKAQMKKLYVVLTSCPESDIETTLSQWCLPVAELCLSLKK